MNEPFHNLSYESQNNQVQWQGVELIDGEFLQSFLSKEVAERMDDLESKSEFESHLLGLAGTGFARESLKAILDADLPEERDWAAGEALAEAWLEKEHNVVWPWNTGRDKRTPKASLPGADLVGFLTTGDETRLVLGEVKSSSEARHPPQVMSGRSGMTHQLDRLATDLSIVVQLLKWLFPRCKNSEFENQFNAALRLYFESGNKAISLFGVLIRDTEANESDLRSRGKTLGESVDSPTSCHLMALYLPFKLSEMPLRIHGGSA
ncbi:MAG: hypothetical protein HQ517_05870 [SAR324 cluster bacterium]|nr:hypothetical protein [SAR324 cluster bacterium]